MPDTAPEENIKTNCLKGTFDGCQYSGWYNSNVVCFVCIKGFPSVHGKQCVKFEDLENGSGPQVNCLWGARVYDNNACFKCEEGFMVVGGGCVKQKIEGCLQADVKGEVCEVCDIWDGFGQVSDDGSCKKYVGGEEFGNGAFSAKLKKYLDLVKAL